MKRYEMLFSVAFYIVNSDGETILAGTCDTVVHQSVLSKINSCVTIPLFSILAEAF